MLTLCCTLPCFPRSIDVDNAKATVASDKAMILADIVKRHGSTQVCKAFFADSNQSHKLGFRIETCAHVHPP